MLIDLANRTVTDNGADVVILAGAPLAGLANKIRDRVPVPLVDGIQAAVAWPRGWCASIRARRRPAPIAGPGQGLQGPVARRSPT